MEKIYEFYPLDNTVMIGSDSGRNRYDCLGFAGSRACILGSIIDPTATSGDNVAESFHDSNKNILNKCISQYFPLDLFHGKCTGDLVTMKFKPCPKNDTLDDDDNADLVPDTSNVEIIVKLSSLEGKFEDKLYYGSHSFGGVYSPINNMELSESAQKAMIISAHICYSSSIGRNDMPLFG